MGLLVGLGVHSTASVFVIQDGHGQVMAQGEMPTTPAGFRRWYEAQQLPARTPVALETGTVAFFVAREPTALACAFPKATRRSRTGDLLITKGRRRLLRFRR